MILSLLRPEIACNSIRAFTLINWLNWFGRLPPGQWRGVAKVKGHIWLGHTHPTHLTSTGPAGKALLQKAMPNSSLHWCNAHWQLDTPTSQIRVLGVISGLVQATSCCSLAPPDHIFLHVWLPRATPYHLLTLILGSRLLTFAPPKTMLAILSSSWLSFCNFRQSLDCIVYPY